MKMPARLLFVLDVPLTVFWVMTGDVFMAVMCACGAAILLPIALDNH